MREGHLESRAVAGAETVNTLGFCVGGTMLGTGALLYSPDFAWSVLVVQLVLGALDVRFGFRRKSLEADAQFPFFLFLVPLFASTGSSAGLTAPGLLLSSPRNRCHFSLSDLNLSTRTPAVVRPLCSSTTLSHAATFPSSSCSSRFALSSHRFVVSSNINNPTTTTR